MSILIVAALVVWGLTALGCPFWLAVVVVVLFG